MEMNSVENRLSELEKQYSRIEEKLDFIISIFQKDVAPNCEKMSGHIDFVENVYENVKNPLGYLCNKVGSFIGNDSYSLDNIKTTQPQLQDIDDKEQEQEYDSYESSEESYESE
jgi:phosphomevalonate kinase